MIDETEGPLFYFTLGGEDKGPATTAVTLEPTESGREYIQRLMLQQGDYKDDYSIYSIDSLEQWVEEFRGFYICPDPAMPLTADRGEGTIFGTTLESSGFAVYGRNRVEADPTLIQDTLQMLYYFYEGSVDHGNVSVNTAYHDYSQAKEALFEIANAREPAAGEADERPETARVRVEGFGGVVSDITFTEAFFEALEREIEKANEAEGKDFRTLAFSQVTMSVYFNDGAYDWQEIVPGNGSGPDIVRLTDEMTAAPPAGPLHELQDADPDCGLQLHLRVAVQHDARLRRIREPQPGMLQDEYHGLRPGALEQLHEGEAGRRGRGACGGPLEGAEPHDLPRPGRREVSTPRPSASSGHGDRRRRKTTLRSGSNWRTT